MSEAPLEVDTVNATNATCHDNGNWATANACGDWPISMTLVMVFTIAWGGLFVAAGVRLLFNSNSAFRDTAVAKKLQFVQAWFFSYFHTLVDILALFAVIGLCEEKEFIPAVLLLAFYALNLSLTSTVDVIGTVGRHTGVNGFNFSVCLEYLSTTYLAKAVWKLSGHKETGINHYSKEDKREQTTLTKIFCLDALYNAHSPRVYDFKDVVGIQGAYLGLPALFTLLLTLIRSRGRFSEESVVVEQEVEVDGQITLENVTEIKDLFADFDFTPLISVVAVMAFISTISTPILGDWETFHKNFIKCVGSVGFRSLEIMGRFGFYLYFFDFSRFWSGWLLLAEFGFMWMTCLQLQGVSSAGRTGGLNHRLLASWESVFFTNYRRVHVDKDLVAVNMTLMPAAIELLRFFVRTIATVIGYVSMSAITIPKSYTYAYEEVKVLPVLFVIGIGANFSVVVLNLIGFFVINRHELKSADLSKLKYYWCGLPGIYQLFGPKEAHINRDNHNFHSGNNPIHYL